MQGRDLEKISSARRVLTEASESSAGGYLQHRLARIQDKQGSQAHHNQILDMIKKSSGLFKNSPIKLSHKKTVSIDNGKETLGMQTPLRKPSSSKKSPQIVSSNRTPIIHKRSNSSLYEETPNPTPPQSRTTLPSLEELTPGRRPNIAGDKRKFDTIIRSRRPSRGGDEQERPTNFSQNSRSSSFRLRPGYFAILHGKFDNNHETKACHV